MKPIETNKETSKDKTISIRLNTELHSNLMRYKKKNNINLSVFIRGIIADRLEYLRRKNK